MMAIAEVADATPYELTTLPSGLRVITAHMPHTRSAAVQVFIRAGARNEPPELSGISHFVEHMVFKGTKRRPNPIQISEAIEGVGGAMNAATDHEHTNFRALVPSTHLAIAVDVLADMILGSEFAPKEIAKERAVIIEEINSTYDSPPEIVDLLFDEMLWGTHPLGRDIAGSKQTVRRIKRLDLIEHVRTHYRPEATVISIAGNVEHDEVLGLLEEYWVQDGSPAEAARLDEAAPPTPGDGPRVMSFRKRTEQTNLMVGVPALSYTHPDRYTQDVLDALLGGGMSSRLFVEVRENLALAYSVSSFVKSYHDVGVFGVHAAVDNDRIVPALDAIMAELKRIKTERVPEQELRKVKEFIKGHTMLSLERSGYVAHWAGWQELMLGRIDAVDDVLEKVEAVTVDDVLELAERLFKTDRMHLAIVGPVKSDDLLAEHLRLD
jgi:predicted Zn-dependent peptidase